MRTIATCVASTHVNVFVVSSELKLCAKCVSGVLMIQNTWLRMLGVLVVSSELKICYFTWALGDWP